MLMTSYIQHVKNHLTLKANSAVTLKRVTKSDCPFLYNLLSERDPRINISHKKMPPYHKHVKFVMSKPYSVWYIVNYKNQKVGSIYLTNQDEIGIFLERKIKYKGIGRQALNLLMKRHPRSRYLANINPKNIKSVMFFQKNGFHLIQHTYELVKSRDA